MMNNNYELEMTVPDYVGFRELLPHIEIGYWPTLEGNASFRVHLEEEDLVIIKLRFPMIVALLL